MAGNNEVLNQDDDKVELHENRTMTADSVLVDTNSWSGCWTSTQLATFTANISDAVNDNIKLGQVTL